MKMLIPKNNGFINRLYHNQHRHLIINSKIVKAVFAVVGNALCSACAG
jgi:hypothetical protein